MISLSISIDLYGLTWEFPGGAGGSGCGEELRLLPHDFNNFCTQLTLFSFFEHVEIKSDACGNVLGFFIHDARIHVGISFSFQ